MNRDRVMIEEIKAEADRINEADAVDVEHNDAETATLEAIRKANENLYVILPSDTKHGEVLRPLAEEKFPGCRIVQELRLDRLTENNVVQTLFYDMNKSAPKDGEQPPVWSKRVCVSDHFDKGASDDGNLRVGGFMRELASYSSPSVLRFRGDSRTLRLRYA